MLSKIRKRDRTSIRCLTCKRSRYAPRVLPSEAADERATAPGAATRIAKRMCLYCGQLRDFEIGVARPSSDLQPSVPAFDVTKSYATSHTITHARSANLELRPLDENTKRAMMRKRTMLRARRATTEGEVEAAIGLYGELLEQSKDADGRGELLVRQANVLLLHPRRSFDDLQERIATELEEAIPGLSSRVRPDAERYLARLRT